MKGKDFEHIITLIETSLSDSDSLSVKHDIEILDRDGNMRQIDVLIEVHIGTRFGKELILVECKDWKSKVKVSDIGAFIDLVKSTNAIKGIYVSKKGFQIGAINKANGNQKILLKTLDQIDKKEIFNWFKPGDTMKWSIETTDQGFQVKPQISLPDTFNSPLPQMDDSFILIHRINYREYLLKYCVDKAIKFVKYHSNEIILETFKEYGKTQDKIEKQIQIEVKFDKEEATLIHNENEFQLLKIFITVGVIIKSELSKKIISKKYVAIENKEIEAEIVTAEFKNDQFSFVKTISKNDIDVYYHSKNSKDLAFNKLKLLGNINENKNNT